MAGCEAVEEVGGAMFLRDLSVLREGEASRRAAREWRDTAEGC